MVQTFLIIVYLNIIKHWSNHLCSLKKNYTQHLIYYHIFIAVNDRGLANWFTKKVICKLFELPKNIHASLPNLQRIIIKYNHLVFELLSTSHQTDLHKKKIKCTEIKIKKINPERIITFSGSLQIEHDCINRFKLTELSW